MPTQHGAPPDILAKAARRSMRVARLRLPSWGQMATPRPSVGLPACTRSSARGDAIRAMLCAPLWSGPAHVVALGSVGVTRRGHQSLQRPCDRAGSAPQQISDKQHIDEIEIRRCTHVCPRSDKLKTPTLRYPYRRSDWLQDAWHGVLSWDYIVG